MIHTESRPIGRIELDQDMLRQMLGMFETHADARGRLSLHYRGNVVMVKHPKSGKSDVLGSARLPRYIGNRVVR